MAIKGTKQLDYPTKSVPFFYTQGQRKNLFISLFNHISSELIEKKCGVGIQPSTIWKSAELRPLWLEFRKRARESGWEGVNELTGKAAIIALFRQMIITMALNKRPNVKPESVYSTAEFTRFSRKCDVFFSTDGSFIEYGPRFEAFLEAYNIN